MHISSIHPFLLYQKVLKLKMALFNEFLICLMFLYSKNLSLKSNLNRNLFEDLKKNFSVFMESNACHKKCNNPLKQCLQSTLLSFVNTII